MLYWFHRMFIPAASSFEGIPSVLKPSQPAAAFTSLSIPDSSHYTVLPCLTLPCPNLHALCFWPCLFQPSFLQEVAVQ